MPCGLPSDTERVVRLAAIPPHLKRTLALLPTPLGIRARLPRDERALPTAARQLLKLALLGVGATLESVEFDDALEIAVVLRRERQTLGAADLEGDLAALLPRLLVSLFQPDDVGALLDRLAFQSASLETLRTVTGRMLVARDLQEAHRLLLAGLTSGFGLGFHRAVLFTRDPALGSFVAVRAVGPCDDEEAHRIWESIELEDATIDHILAETPASSAPGKLERLAAEITLDPAGGPARAALAEHGVRVLARTAADGSPLARLDPADPFILAALAARDQILGLVWADDRFGPRPLAPERLAHAELFLDHAALVLENLALLERVSRLARTDPLTGLLNRRELEARFELERSRSERELAPLALLAADIDGFKQTNDSRGHAAGDAVLRALAAVLSHSFRAHDAVARVGGDEFSVLLPGADRAALVAAARRLGSEALATGISLSLGGACFPGDTPDMTQLTSLADASLYRAKQAGRSCAYVGQERIEFGPGRPGTPA